MPRAGGERLRFGLRDEFLRVPFPIAPLRKGDLLRVRLCAGLDVRCIPFPLSFSPFVGPPTLAVGDARRTVPLRDPRSPRAGLRRREYRPGE